MGAIPGAAGRSSAFGRVLRDGRLRSLIAAYFWFCSAEYGVWVAVLVYAYTRGGTTLAGLIALAQLAPATIAAPLGTKLIDRVGCAEALALGYAGQFATLTATAIAMLASLPAPIVYVCAAAAATSLVVIRPAYASLLPSMVEEPQALTAANVVNGWVDNASVLVGPGLTGVLIAIDGPGLAVAWFAATMGLSCVLGSRRPDHEPDSAPADDDDASAEEAAIPLLDAFTADRPVTLLLLVLGVQFAALGALDVLEVTLAISVLGLGASGAGYLEAAYGIGCIIGAAGNVLLVDARRVALWVVVGMAGAGVCLITLGARATTVLAFVLLGGVGTGHAVTDVASRTLLHRVVPPRLQVSIFGLQETMMMLGLAIGSVSAPVLTHLTSNTGALVVVGSVLVGSVALVTPALLRIERRAPVPQDRLAALRGSPLLGMLGRPVLEDLARALIPITLGPGVTVIREGEVGDRFYLVGSGQLGVVVTGHAARTLGPGDGFGEIALLREIPRTATVTTLTDASVYALDREPFLTALTGSAQAHDAVESLANERLSHR